MSHFAVLAAEVGDPIFCAVTKAGDKRDACLATGAGKGIELLSTVFLAVLVKVVVCFALLLISVMFLVWFERKVISDMQNRVGPNRAGPWGLLQTLADGTKLFFKEHLFPERADMWVFRLAPYLAAVPAFLAFAVVPVGGTLKLFGHRTQLQMSDPPIGVLLPLAVTSIAVYGVMLAGWSSGSKYPLLGAVRASAQMISYEAALGLSVATVVLASGSLRTSDIVESQTGSFRNWYFLALGFIPVVIFAIAGTAELNRPPFDLVEAESELVGGFNTEYTSARFAFFFLAEFMNTITMSAMLVTLFLAGPTIPWNVPFFTSVSPVWFLAKLLVLLFVHVWVRATLPRFRYDQLMDLGWKKLIPAALFWLLIRGSMQLRPDRGYWPLVLTFGGCVIAGLLLYRALQVGRARGEDEVAASTGKTAATTRPGRF